MSAQPEQGMSVELPVTFDLATAAERLGVSRDWLARQTRAGHVPHYLVGSRRLFTDAHLAAYLASREQQPTDPWARTSHATPRARRTKTTPRRTS